MHGLGSGVEPLDQGISMEKTLVDRSAPEIVNWMMDVFQDSFKIRLKLTINILLTFQELWKKLFSDIIYMAGETKYLKEVVEAIRRRGSIKNMKGVYATFQLAAGRMGFLRFLKEISPEISLVIYVSHSFFNQKVDTKTRLLGVVIINKSDQQSEVCNLGPEEAVVSGSKVNGFAQL
ncbi:hypothetical protein CCACVL1_21341 [Corchorus capsularis]|uniref:Uncharacterized protein n=1 Tax=Corchorus capsularis TaxID=210143 RepID=A0A1R3H6E9_COCAP|nr:hypothetical protein CCACVL1_21341 [Corchorus capsularis]